MNMVGVIAKREYVERIKQRGWIIGTIIGVVVIIGLSFMPLIIVVLSGVFGTPTNTAVLVPDARAKSAIKEALGDPSSGFELHFLAVKAVSPNLPERVTRALKAGKYDAALVAYRERNGDIAFKYYARKASALDQADGLRRRLLTAALKADLRGTLASQIDRRLDFHFAVTSLNERYRTAAEEAVSQGLSVFLLIMMYMAVILYGVAVAQGVIEEKANRVMEIMIGAIRPVQLLAGKIIGIGLLALTQFAIFGVVGLIMIVISALFTAHAIGPSALPSMPVNAGGGSALAQGVALATVPWSTWVYLLVFFLLGFFSYATISAGIGALASKAEDVQSASSIYTIPMIAAYLISFFAISEPDKPFVLWASMVPLLSPMVMFTRIAAGTAPAWQIAVSIVLSLVAIYLLTKLAAKLYRAGVLMYGKPPRPIEVWRALRAPT